MRPDVRIEPLVIHSAMAKAGEQPLKMTCKRYSTDFCSPEGVTLLFTHCVGAHKEQWEPTIEALFEAQVSKPRSHRIREAWSFDWPSHGEGALVNEDILKNRSQYISAFEWVQALVAFLKGPWVSGHRIVGIGHSAGANSITIPLDAFPESTPPYTALILIEPTSISFERYMRETDRHEPKTQMRTEATMTRRDTWPSRSEAYSWLKKRLPWKLWDDRVLQTYVDDGMYTTPNGISLKMPKRMEALTYPDVEPLWAATAVLRRFRSIIPVHMIFGTRNDFVSRSHQDDLCDITAGAIRRRIIRIEGAGHLIVQERPSEVANAIWDVLDGMFSAKSHM